MLDEKERKLFLRSKQTVSLPLKLHIFNPSHDEALASGNPYFCPSTAARELEAEWVDLPAFTAKAGDAVWIQKDAALPEDTESFPDIRFVHTKEMTPQFWNTVQQIEPWGFDPLICRKLRAAGAPEALFPSEAELEQLRLLSARTTTAALLPRLRNSLHAKGIDTVGQSFIARSLNQARDCITRWQGAVIKSLWSCSGRGVFRVGTRPTVNELGRISRLVTEHGAVEVEPVYEARLNFALEFEAEAGGAVHYVGLSIFAAHKGGRYMSNLVASQKGLEAKLVASGFSRLQTLVDAVERELSSFLAGRYQGPLGVDMMLVEPAKPLTALSEPGLVTGDEIYESCLHPCVEVNLRRTMGHLALGLAQIKLKPTQISRLSDNFFNFAFK